MQLLMRRPEIRGFISIAPPANMYDFSFLAPCPSSGIIIQGEADEVVTPGAVQKLVDKLRTQRHITIHHDTDPRREPLLRKRARSVDEVGRRLSRHAARHRSGQAGYTVQIITFMTSTSAATIIRIPRPLV